MNYGLTLIIKEIIAGCILNIDRENRKVTFGSLLPSL